MAEMDGTVRSAAGRRPGGVASETSTVAVTVNRSLAAEWFVTVPRSIARDSHEMTIARSAPSAGSKRWKPSASGW